MKQAAASQEYSLLREETIAGETAMAWFLEAQGKKNRHWFSLRKGLFLHHGENYPLLSLREKLQKTHNCPFLNATLAILDNSLVLCIQCFQGTKYFLVTYGLKLYF